MALAEFFAEKHIAGSRPLVNIIDFSESADFLGLKLFPVQRFVFKLMYNIPLSENLKEPILLPDKFNEKTERTFTSEVRFKQFLYDTGRLNSLTFRYPIIESYLVIGRRGTKTTITSIISAYKLYLVLSQYDPQGYFGIVGDSEISFMVCSNTKVNARKII